MKFGPLDLRNAKSGILAHSLSLPDGKRIRKGVVIDDAIIAQLVDAGVITVTVAMPEQGDVLEDAAATLIARQFEAPNIRIEEASTGRVNIFAKTNGVVRFSSPIINAINTIDPTITIATLPDYASVNDGRLIATIKIIPYAVTSLNLESVLALDLTEAVKLVGYKSQRIGLISTKLPTLKPTVMDKTRANLEHRLALSGSVVVEEIRVSHDTSSIKNAIDKLAVKSDMLILFGASAISDISDCIPQAIERAGGKIIRFGMPVDPGNLMLLAKIDDTPIVGAPGCARSIAENGFDWVLQRLLAGVDVTDNDIAGMGVGGLLMETGSRPHPREKNKHAQGKIAAIVLAAGQSRRMGDKNKMTVEIADKPMVRHVVEAAIGSSSQDVVVVTGHKQQEVQGALDGLKFNHINNSAFERGLSTSLIGGIESLPSDASHALVLLGDMPFITSAMINQLIEAAADNASNIIVSTHEGKRGNPVLWPRVFFDELCSIQGDIGARHIMAANQDRVIEVELGEAASLDLDTPEAVQMVREKG